jgi:acetolactate decarboxylase
MMQLDKISGIPEHVIEELAAYCEMTGRSSSDVMARALQSYMRASEKGNALYLSAPVNSLLKGFYEQDTFIYDLKKYGDFGLGTFNNLDGEMLMIDGRVYRLGADGFTYDIDDGTRTPFACVTFFSPDLIEDIEGDLDFAAFNSILDRLIVSRNMLYAIRIEGLFNSVKVWSVQKQENYHPLKQDEGSADRPIFEFEDVRGTLAGFYVPRFIKSLSMPGFHLHFLTQDTKRGGHLHECRLQNAHIAMQAVPRLILNLPITLDYLTASLNR